MDSFIRKKMEGPPETRLCPPIQLPESRTEDNLSWSLEWEVFSCQMLNRLCSLHLAQEHGDIYACEAHTHTHSEHRVSILADIIPLSESLAGNQR